MDSLYGRFYHRTNFVYIMIKHWNPLMRPSSSIPNSKRTHMLLNQAYRVTRVLERFELDLSVLPEPQKLVVLEGLRASGR